MVPAVPVKMAPVARSALRKTTLTRASEAVARGAQGAHPVIAIAEFDMKPFPEIDPTRTSNPERPRTLQAGYDKKAGQSTGTLRVRFRDGSPWEYYEVEPEVWQRFKRSASPGKFINRVLNGYSYGPGSF